MGIAEKFPALTVERSRAEHVNEERIFLFVKSTVAKAGKPLTVTAFNPVAVTHDTSLLAVINSSGITVVSPEGLYEDL